MPGSDDATESAAEESIFQKYPMWVYQQCLKVGDTEFNLAETFLKTGPKNSQRRKNRLRKASKKSRMAQTTDPPKITPTVAAAKPAPSATFAKPVNHALRTHSTPSQSNLRERLVSLIAALSPSLPLPEFREQLHQISEVRGALALQELVSGRVMRAQVRIHMRVDRLVLRDPTCAN